MQTPPGQHAGAVSESTENCRATQSGQENWEVVLVLAGSGDKESLAAKPNLQVTVSDTECLSHQEKD